jgi:hypothetical protein
MPLISDFMRDQVNRLSFSFTNTQTINLSFSMAFVVTYFWVPIQKRRKYKKIYLEENKKYV